MVTMLAALLLAAICGKIVLRVRRPDSPWHNVVNGVLFLLIVLNIVILIRLISGLL